jgi:RNA polymerase sigma-70 factor (ECF subfamily)
VNPQVRQDPKPASASPPVPPRPVFADVYAQHHAVVFGYLRARVLDSHDAEDLCQEAFLRAFAALERYDPSRDVRPWLLGISRNVLREHIRRVGRRKETGWTELCLELEGLVGEDSPYQDTLDLLPVCMSHLGEAAYNALHWHYMQGLKIERTLGAVKVLMVRARQALKRCFESHLSRKTP